ncbi:hypothetical protein U468_08785 [Campylobacter coli K3]|nr:hypothetical protein YSQ_00080 [Campylobacter coli RM1875]AHK75914.1 hypothetical protein YSU_00085 [Campylobacter coli RM5611]AHK77762.1 hypothetical protein YSS_00080 [Campylobacter coli RM4661]ETC93698.1 hypothetical protein U468_08785 [Campylobacter coli K3]ETC96956.1 hypothetical protein U469_01390 [Campylobacter coli K7]
MSHFVLLFDNQKALYYKKILLSIDENYTQKAYFLQVNFIKIKL